MGLEKDTYQLLQPIISAMDRTFTINSVVDLGGGKYTLNSCNTLWLTFGYVFTHNAVEYTVYDLITNEYVMVTGASLPVKGDATISEPFFDHGTLLMQNAEMKLKPNIWDKLPMIYLHEPTDDRDFPQDNDESTGREAGCDLYFMIDCNYSNWLTNDHFRYAVRPMRNLMKLFIEELKNSSNVGVFESYEAQNYPNWGVYSSDKGAVKRLIDDELSGCGLKITIPFLKSLICEC